jgi:hypothetical protein
MFGPGRSDGGIVKQASGIKIIGSKDIKNGKKTESKKTKGENL